MFLLVSVRHVGAHPDELQHGVSIQSSINLGKTFLWISRIRIIPSTQIFARVFVYLPPFISKILDFICRMVLIFILIYFEWRDTENQQFKRLSAVIRAQVIEKEQHAAHCKTAEILEWQVIDEKMNSNSMRNRYKNNTSVFIQERARLNVSKNLTICSLMVVF